MQDRRALTPRMCPLGRSYFTGQVQPGTAPRASGGSDSDVSLPAMGHTGASRLHKRSASDAAFTAASAQPPKRAATQSPPPFAAEAAALPGSLAPVAQAAAMLNLLTPSEGPYLVLPAHFEGVQLPRIKQALGSGVASEAAWSLNALLVASCDARSELRLATLPGLAQALLSLITRTMTSRIYLQLPPGSQGAAAAVQALPRRCGPSCRPQDYEADDEARATRAIAPAMRERVLSDPMEGAEREEAMAACAAALVLRNCSFNPFNAAMMATPDAASAALVFLRCELAASSMVFEAVPGEGPLESLVDYFCEPCFPERAACASDLLQLLLHAAPHVSLIHGQQSSALTLNSFGRVCLGALSIPPSAWPLWPQRAAAGAELLSLLATNANASAFMPNAVLGTPHTIIPPLLNLLTDEAHEPNAAAAAALVRLAEMRNAKHRAYLAAVPGIVDTLLCTIRRPGASSSVQRHCAAMLAALASSMSEATPQLMARAPELIQLAVGDGPVAFHASRALKATVTRDIVLGPPELRRRP